ncbi:Uncharacterised protein [Mycobacteroides abscessus subsp. massiliense]|nr:Uncharacterised protein [Mycobacteroides abscessus subsp. massiliense]
MWPEVKMKTVVRSGGFRAAARAMATAAICPFSSITLTPSVWVTTSTVSSGREVPSITVQMVRVVVFEAS